MGSLLTLTPTTHISQGICLGSHRSMMCVCVCVCESLSHVRLFATPWTVACQALLSMEFSWQEYWSALSFPSPGDLPDPGIKPRSPALQADFFYHLSHQGKPNIIYSIIQILKKATVPFLLVHSGQLSYFCILPDLHPFLTLPHSLGFWQGCQSCGPHAL